MPGSSELSSNPRSSRPDSRTEARFLSFCESRTNGVIKSGGEGHTEGVEVAKRALFTGKNTLEYAKYTRKYTSFKNEHST